MRKFKIEAPDEGLRPAIQTKIDNLNKPKGSLGRLEELAMQVCLIQQTLSPSLQHPCHLLLGGDHGIEREGVSVSPREVTWQQMINFTRGGGGVNMFCRQHGFKLRIVDVGVDYDLSHIDGIIDRKIARGTRNFLYEPAMTEEEFDRAIEVGAALTDDCIAEGCRVLSIGEMGIGNTSPSSIWMHLFGDIPLGESNDNRGDFDNKTDEELLALRARYKKFEKSIFAWGWWTGTMAMGIALLRIVDPKQASRAMDDYALAYLPCAPVEILLITFVPIMFAAGQGLWLMLGCLALSLLILWLAKRLKWWIPKNELK